MRALTPSTTPRAHAGRSTARASRVVAAATEGKTRVAIAGGGLWGTACAYFCQRSNLCQVTIGGEGPNETTVTCSRGVRLEADARLEDVADERWDLIALPGGMPGAQNMANDATLHRALERQMGERGALTAAMCASPGVVLAAKGLLHGLAATAHPGFVKNLPDAASANARVVVDGDVITSRGPGTAIEFALALVEKLYGAAKAQEVAGPMVLPSVSHGNRVPNEWRLDDAAVLEN